jgi:CRISPR-associated endonuclease/helicase Cas3
VIQTTRQADGPPALARPTEPVEAVRVELYAPVASFRDPMFPGVSRGLPVPPPATVRGMLAAATGRPAEPVPLALAAWSDGEGVDTETYHPVAVDGGNPPVGGRVPTGKGGMTIRDRPFLVGVHLTVWIPAPDGDRIGAAIRRPVWGLRLGRSQDLVHIRRVTRTTLVPTDEAEVGHALAPPGGHTAPGAAALRLADTVTADRLRTAYSSYLWCARPAGRHRVRGAYRDGDQAVWLQWTDGAGGQPATADEAPATPAAAAPAAGAAADDLDELGQVLAKSARGSRLGRPETLAEHSAAVRAAARAIAGRIGPAGPLASEPRFWAWVEQAALLHDAGKVAEGFQRQLRPGARPWGERHEVLSLAYVDLLTAGVSDLDRLMVATGVAFHHRCLTSDSAPFGTLQTMYPHDTDWSGKFGRALDPPPDGPRVQVTPARHAALAAWLAAQLNQPPPAPGGGKLWERARDTFRALAAAWSDCPDPDRGLLAVLLQGAVTLADHSGSAHVRLQTHLPLPPGYLARLPAPYPHQSAAGAVDGHLVLLAPTGSGPATLTPTPARRRSASTAAGKSPASSATNSPQPSTTAPCAGRSPTTNSSTSKPSRSSGSVSKERRTSHSGPGGSPCT